MRPTQSIILLHSVRLIHPRESIHHAISTYPRNFDTRNSPPTWFQQPRFLTTWFQSTHKNIYSTHMIPPHFPALPPHALTCNATLIKLSASPQRPTIPRQSTDSNKNKHYSSRNLITLSLTHTTNATKKPYSRNSVVGTGVSQLEKPWDECQR